MSNPVSSSQTGIHPNLQKVLEKHFASKFLKTPAEHTIAAFRTALDFVKNGKPIILDSGCGTGDSTIYLAKKYYQCSVIGIDKSEVRLQAAKSKVAMPNLLFLRADMFDFWALSAKESLKLFLHTIYYPNPWPKPEHLMRRIYGHPLFFEMIKFGKTELRTNWKIYADEFAFALNFAKEKCGLDFSAEVKRYVCLEPVSQFEKKYFLSKQDLWKVVMGGLCFQLLSAES